ncbi:RPM1-interacting protein 4-like, partial [Phalaenopsis equestris]|uniref:RPM1-interacting protein 4-like n=1 Tax=Phalaenopsis equestris TaxID=78828 RepID=UPI0009E20D79
LQQNARVPQFGKWENDGSVPYTQYFENARKGKNATKLFNPNDPLQNPEAFQQEGPLIHTYPPSSQGSAKAKHERRKSREDADRNQASKYTSAEALPSHKLVSGSPNRRHDQGNLGHPPRKQSQSNVESDHSTDRSPVHPHLHYRSSSKGTISSPSRERRSSSDKHGLAPNTPGRTKMKPSDRNDYSVDKGSAVPKFGEWDVMDPASADSYSYIFNQVREEKHSGSTKIPSNSRESKSNGQKKRVNSEST